VLTELVYRWFSPPGGQILDPFAGGSVRGVVASYLGRHYSGIDLSRRQIDANWTNLTEIFSHEGGGFPGSCQWLEGNACYDIPKYMEPESMDFAFSCPPYYDLEVYSDDTRDLSVGTWDEFLVDYRTAIAATVAALKPNRFAAIVVGEIRDKKTGMYRNFVGETVRAFEDAGAHFYNEAILVTPVGSIRMTVARQFEASRKLGKRHQQLLVFVKNDPKLATRACTGEIEPGVM
jgi:DNA modification methylase